MKVSSRVTPELEDVASQVGDFIEYWGFKKIHGRIWVHLFLTQKPLNAGELISRLKVSKALISMSLSELVDYDVIFCEGKCPSGTSLYRANPDVTSVITNILRVRERRMLGRIAAATKLLCEVKGQNKECQDLDSQRVKALSEMVKSAEANLDGILQFSEVAFDVWSEFSQCSQEKP
jgi:DNA-binding transcriptional regulator GbsR (MarR family)